MNRVIYLLVTALMVTALMSGCSLNDTACSADSLVCNDIYHTTSSALDAGTEEKSGYVPYDQLTGDYSLENAKADNCVVFENSRLTSGSKAWREFIDKTEAGEKAFVRLAYYYTLDSQRVSPELYEEIKDDYPKLFIKDLSFDCENYHLYYAEGEKEYESEYPYMMHYSGKARSGAAFSRYDCYILVRDKNVTYEQIEKGMLSSILGDQIDHVSVYTNLIP